jgi:hypothetical protein
MMMQHLRCLILETFSVGLSYDIKTKEIWSIKIVWW